MESFAPDRQPLYTGVATLQVASARKLHDDGARLRRRKERQGIHFPVGYAEDEQGLVTFTRFPWWKNFREERPVSVRLRGREVPGIALAERDSERVRERFAYYLKRNPHDGRYFGVRVGRDGRADPDELARAAARLVMIRTVLEDTSKPWRGAVEV